MKPQHAISSELLALAPFLATVKKDNPFGVPQGYFAQLELNTLSKVLEANELNAQAPVTMQLRQKQDMTVPKDYFEELYHTVMATNLVQEIQTNPLPQAPFTTPEGYFDQLHQTILQQVTDLAQDEQADEALILAAANEGLTTPAGFFAEMQTNIWKRITNLADEETNLNTHTIDQVAANDGFTTPEGYFAESTEALLYAVTNQEEYLPETLQQIKNAPAFGTPQGYFDQLQQALLQKTAQQPKSAKEVTMPAQRQQSVPALRYALRVAAVVAMLFVGWQLLNRSADTGNNGELALLTPNPALLAKMETAMIEAGITQKDLQFYISNNADEFTNFDLEELNITASDLSIKNTTSKSIQLTPEAMDMLDISADDIDQFLSE